MESKHPQQVPKPLRQSIQEARDALNEGWSVEHYTRYNELCAMLWEKSWNSCHDSFQYQLNQNLALASSHSSGTHISAQTKQNISCILDGDDNSSNSNCNKSAGKCATKREETMDKKWMKRYNELARFHRANGHCNVPYKFKENKSLGLWVQCQRTRYSKKCISPRRKEMLNDIGFNWVVGKKRITWGERYEELVIYYNKYGHSNVPLSSKEYHLLAVWVCCQRQNYRKELQGTSNSLTKQRVEALEKIEFQWSLNEGSWHEHYQELKLSIDQDCSNRAPKRCELSSKLSRWVATQRNQYSKARQGQTSCMSQRRIEKLEEIGFVWRECDA